MARKDRRRADHYTQAARSRGYPARSVFKLEQIDARRDLLAPGRRVLDLGAAPGSWSRYAAGRVGRSGTVVAVDLKPLEETVPRGGSAHIIVITGDFTEEGARAAIRQHAPFDIVMSDAAPATSGNRVLDTARSEALVESILASLPDWLRHGGTLVCKVFQGGGQQELLRQSREVFTSVAMARPDAVRRESFEAYVVARGYQGGAKKKEAAPESARP